MKIIRNYSILLLLTLFVGCNKNSIDRLSYENDFYIRFSNSGALFSFIDTNNVQISNTKEVTCTLGAKGEDNTEFLTINFPSGTTKLSGEVMKTLIGVRLPFAVLDTVYPGKFTATLGFSLGGKEYTTRNTSILNKSSAYGITIKEVELYKTVVVSPTKTIGYYEVRGTFYGYATATEAEPLYLKSGNFRVLLQEYK